MRKRTWYRSGTNRKFRDTNSGQKQLERVHVGRKSACTCGGGGGWGVACAPSSLLGRLGARGTRGEPLTLITPRLRGAANTKSSALGTPSLRG